MEHNSKSISLSKVDRIFYNNQTDGKTKVYFFALQDFVSVEIGLWNGYNRIDELSSKKMGYIKMWKKNLWKENRNRKKERYLLLPYP